MMRRTGEGILHLSRDRCEYTAEESRLNGEGLSSSSLYHDICVKVGYDTTEGGIFLDCHILQIVHIHLINPSQAPLGHYLLKM